MWAQLGCMNFSVRGEVFSNGNGDGTLCDFFEDSWTEVSGIPGGGKLECRKWKCSGVWIFFGRVEMVMVAHDVIALKTAFGPRGRLTGAGYSQRGVMFFEVETTMAHDTKSSHFVFSPR